MNWLNNLKVRTKLMLVIAVMATGFVTIGAVYTISVVNQNNSIETLDRLAQERYEILGTSELMLQARRAEKDFLLRSDLKYDKRHDGIMEKLFELSDNLIADFNTGHGDTAHAQSTAAENTIRGELMSKVRGNLQDYQKTYKEMVQAKIDLGLDENSGLQGAFRKAVHEVEELVNAENNPVLLSTMLMMRRHEKDFILREAEKYIPRMAKRQVEFAEQLKASKTSPENQRAITEKLATYHDGFLKLVAGTKLVREKIAVYRDAVHKVDPALAELTKTSNELEQVENAEISEGLVLNQTLMISAVMISALLILSLVTVVTRSLTNSLGRLGQVVNDVAQGNYDARAELEARDELGELGRALDAMLEDRLTTAAKAEAENNRLNDSIIDMLEAVSDLSDRDLTIRVPVAEDVTGPVADAMNLMAAETARVLNQIREISAQVESASGQVQAQGNRVTELATNERQVVEDTMGRLDESSKSMDRVAKLANACNQTAAKASESTQQALETVARTATGMNEIRETISETEKRIKRLGERSQEINGVVEIINNIAERTHVLALNASMQAAAAGDAGRGFAVVADEVQRLAESSRQSTSEIAGLVSNIQAETAETMATMNKTITQVVDGTELAQAAGGQMEVTQKTTSELANAVEQIAKQSQAQAQVSIKLLTLAEQVQNSTRDTSAELEQQSSQTENLVEYANRLVESVAVFKLPSIARDESVQLSKAS